jgi:hypothetical protein
MSIKQLPDPWPTPAGLPYKKEPPPLPEYALFDDDDEPDEEYVYSPESQPLPWKPE